ncbi:hypothetical protein ACW7G2_11560 [Luteimonas sp. A277]
MLIYTQMPRLGTNVMLLLGVPFYLWAVFVGLLAASWFPGATLVVLFGAFFIYTFLYSKALYFFVHRMYPRRPVWQFIVGILTVQVLLLAGTVYGVAA